MIAQSRIASHILASLPLSGGARLLLINQGAYYGSYYQAPDKGITSIDQYRSAREGRDAVSKMWVALQDNG